MANYDVPGASGEDRAVLEEYATVWERQLKLAVTKGVLKDYKVVTQWSSSPDD